MNNKYSNFPPIMSDGRILSSWQPAAVLNQQIINKEKIKNNTDYRNFLQKNALSIMSINHTEAYKLTGDPYSYQRTMPDTTPTDLQQSYLSRMELQARANGLKPLI